MHRHRKLSLIQIKTDMSFLRRTRKPLYLLGFCTVLVTAVLAEDHTTPLLTGLSATTISGSVTSSATLNTPSVSYVLPSGGEFSILGGVAGDQVHPQIALTSRGGLVTWEDNGVDRNGSGIGMRRFVGSSFITAPTSTQVNAVAIRDQMNPQVALLATNGLTLVVWQSFVTGNSDIYARIIRTNNIGLTADLRVNTYLKDAQSAPAVVALNDGSAVIVWQSAWQDGCQSGVFARKMAANGRFSTVREFEVNQYNDSGNSRGLRGGRRSPAVSLLANGNFVVTWISEQQNMAMYDSVDVYGRVYTPDCTPVTDEFLISSATINPCANPAVTGLSDGGFMVAWSERDLSVRTNGWDVLGRTFNADGTPRAASYKINTTIYGDQYGPKLAAGPSGVLAVWTSLGQDGNREGVYGRFVIGGTQPAGDEFLVNTTRVSQQIQPTVAWNGLDRFLVVWTSFVARYGFDLYGQAYTLNATP